MHAMRRAFLAGCGIAFLALLHTGCGGMSTGWMPLYDEPAFLAHYAPQYQVAAKKFVATAQNGDVQALVAQMSPKTVRNDGRKKIEKLFETQLVPAFTKGNSVTWDKDAKFIQDGTRNPGILFSLTVHSKPSQPFDIAVFKEDGILVVSTIRRGKP